MPRTYSHLTQDGWEVGQLVEFDYVAHAIWLEQGALAIKDARDRPAVVGQVSEVTDGHIGVVWENGRQGWYGQSATFPWLGDLAWIRRA